MTADAGQTSTKIPIVNNNLNNDTRTIADSKETDTSVDIALLSEEIGERQQVISVGKEAVHPLEPTRLSPDSHPSRTLISTATSLPIDSSALTSESASLTVPLANWPIVIPPVPIPRFKTIRFVDSSSRSMSSPSLNVASIIQAITHPLRILPSPTEQVPLDDRL